MIHVLGIGEGVGIEALDQMAARLARELRVGVRVRDGRLDPGFAFDPVRKQCHATALLRYLSSVCEVGSRLLGVTAVDLYVPIFTFVYGEAQVAGRCAVLSAHRLRQEFYGLPPDEDLFGERLVKEALHELGHTYGLRHCQDWRCAMSSSTTIERLDLKEGRYCVRCWKAAVGAE
ncbi:MAG: archaemetzincin family Zn-dependent metalloprotease [Bryobacterales bacterium]|nr:archaemetzincin family Zn-dependent metalloprotease [Bryobacterales bacterium]